MSTRLVLGVACCGVVCSQVPACAARPCETETSDPPDVKPVTDVKPDFCNASSASLLLFGGLECCRALVVSVLVLVLNNLWTIELLLGDAIRDLLGNSSAVVADFCDRYLSPELIGEARVMFDLTLTPPIDRLTLLRGDPGSRVRELSLLGVILGVVLGVVRGVDSGLLRGLVRGVEELLCTNFPRVVSCSSSI
mmetsp:Transcript_52944/g.92993  ORF Transcript_52944/g.92993 Transcript_52944/m.92993 type:complete len:194 (+) Transcript_52944:503-1084(+)